MCKYARPLLLLKKKPMLTTLDHPIKPPDQKLQYRAIGVIRGIYTPSQESFCIGTITTTDGTIIPALLKPKVRRSVAKKTHADQEYYWVVYPRCNSQALKVQITGLWDPVQNSPVEEFFSIRGQVIFQNFKDKKILVKIKQKALLEGEKSRFFKIKLTGVIPVKAVGKFWEFKVKRNVDKFDIVNGEFISKLPAKFDPRNKKNKSKKQVTPKNSPTAGKSPSPSKSPSHPKSPAPPVIKKKVVKEVEAPLPKPVDAPPSSRVEPQPPRTPKKLSFTVM